MLRIISSKSSFFVSPADDIGARILSQPLHRLFLRSNMKGVLNENVAKWQVPFDNTVEQLLRLTKYFDKYGIEYEYDEKCNRLIKDEKDKRKEYQEILKKGLSVKKHLSKKSSVSLRNTLADGFVRVPTDCQLMAINHLLSVHNGANFSVPGSGKTTVALAYYHLLLKSKLIDRLIIIGPLSCFEPWENEFKECFGRSARSIRISGKSKIQRNDDYLLAGKYELILVSYHTAARDLIELIDVLQRKKYLVVLDESHYIKRPAGGVLADTMLQLSRYAVRKVVMTGTPMPNGFGDLWSQFTFLWHDQMPLGNVESYLREISKNNTEVSFHAVKAKISPLFFRITKHQLNLPRPKFMTIRCELSPVQARIYRGVASKFLTEIKEAPSDRESLREWRKARTIRLLQVASNPALLRQESTEFTLPPADFDDIPLKTAVDHYAKYEIPSKIVEVCKIANELCSKGNKVIIWTTFIHNLKMLQNILKIHEPVVVYGGVPSKTTDDLDASREKLIDRFKNDPNCKIFSANPAACAESISLHKVCHHALYLDRSFNCAHYLQSLDRIHRLGLAKDQETYYYLFIASNTIDEVVQARLREKMKRMNQLIEGEMPGIVPGYWDEELGEEENIDWDKIEEHLKMLLGRK